MFSYKQHWLKNLYDHLPVSLQNLMTSVYGLQHRRRVRGRYYYHYLEQLQKSQWDSTAELERRQNHQLSRFVSYAAQHSPFWRRVFAEQKLEPETIKTPADLSRLPLLEKETVRHMFDELVSDEYRQGGKKAVTVHTSGTTGKALRLKISVECWQREYAFRDDHRTWMGIKPDDRVATLAGHPVVSTNHLKPPFWRRNRAENQLIFSAQHLTPQTMPLYVEELHRFQPHLLHGYPSALYLLALYLDAQNIHTLSPRAVYTHSETLLDNQRALLGRVFGCGVFDGYGNTERVAYIVECEQGSLHVRMEHSVIEFLRADGEHARPGEMAEMVCTGFGNEAMPLIRYRVGDSAIYTERPCRCGRGGTIVEKILGRVDDIIVTPDGRHVGRLDHVFKDLLNVVEAQIVQERIDSVRVRLVKRPEFGAEDMQTLERELRLRLGTKMKLEYEFLERIPREANGKFRAVISKVALAIT
jgi:phenylacetate-CoA ligase